MFKTFKRAAFKSFEILLSFQIFQFRIFIVKSRRKLWKGFFGFLFKLSSAFLALQFSFEIQDSCRLKWKSFDSFS
jgi:hypothetical protein